MSRTAVSGPKETMVLGGAASGKSVFAEKFVIAQGHPRSYVATAQPFDDEMRAKIKAHRAARTEDGWHTVEEAFALAKALETQSSGPVLIDCATLWLSNLMLAEIDIQPAITALFEVLDRHPAPVTIVTNEVGQGIVPDKIMGRQFCTIQGRFNQQLAARADLVVQITAGLPRILKGEMP